jgi:general secretion pathway protein J
MRRARGFTLIELLVAMAIVVVIGVIALGGLNTVINQQEIAEEQAERWREIQLAMRMMVQDLYQVHPRVTRDEAGVTRHASFLADPEHLFALEFSRGGWTNPTGQPRGAVLRVAYDIEETTLLRFYWPVADRTLLTPFGRNEILTGVESMVVTYFDDQLNPLVDWPPLDPSGTGQAGLTERPRAVEIEFILTDLGRVWRLIELHS